MLPSLDADVVKAAPKLKAMAHMGSSVKRFVSDAFWQRNIQLTSAGIALARSVAETTLGINDCGAKKDLAFGAACAGRWLA